MALDLIGSGLGIGRQKLSKELRLGEGIVRTMIRRLKGYGLVEASREGMRLTSKGTEIFKELEERFLTCEFPETSITVGSKNYAVLVKGAAEKVSRGVEQRDAALIAGARGATTLVYKGDQLQMPGVELELDSLTEDFVLSNLKPCDGDVILIGSADTLFDAEIGAKSAALKLLEKMFEEQTSL